MSDTTAEREAVLLRAKVMRAALHADLDDVVAEWCDALRAAMSLAAADRARELRGDRSVKAFTAGVHSYSVEWGRIYACEALLPGLSDVRMADPPCTPGAMAGHARRHAEASFVEQVREGTVEWGG